MSRALLAVLLLLIVSGSSAALSWNTTASGDESTPLDVTAFENAGPPAASPSPMAAPTATPEPALADTLPTEPLASPANEVPGDYLSQTSQRPYPTPTKSAGASVGEQRVTPQWSRVLPPARAPTKLSISDIDVNARVVGVARTETGEMEAPVKYDEVGWYRFGASPGETGRAVLAGHVDSKTGPAVFYRLRELAPGAVIEVTLGGSNEALRYVVQGTAHYPEHEAPLDRIFGPSDRSELILITCSGDFDFDRGAYPDRLVIYADLAPEQS